MRKKCIRPKKLTIWQSTLVAVAVSYIKQGLQLSAERILKSNNLQLTKKQLLSLNASRPTLAQSPRPRRLNLDIHTATLSEDSQGIKCTLSLPKSGNPFLTLEKSMNTKIGKHDSKTKR